MANNLTQLRAFFRALSESDIQRFKTGLDELAADRLNKLAVASEPIEIYRLQGEVNALRQMLREVTECRGQKIA